MNLPVGIDLILEAATLAPSGDNTQPWRFRVDPARRRLTFEVDPARDPSPMNAGQRMSRIALGAAIENALIQARSSGISLEGPEISDEGNSAVLRWLEPGEATTPGIAPLLSRRVTNRRDFEPKAIPGDILDQLIRDHPDRDGVRTIWITSRDRLNAIGEVIGRADAMMFGDPGMRAAFFHNIRFDARPTDPVAEGLSTGSLELKRSERVLLPILRKLPDLLVRVGGAPAAFSARARQVVSGAGGICLTAAEERSSLADIQVGRAMERSWLAINAEGLSAQPMMSLMVLSNALESGAWGGESVRLKLRVARLIEDFRALVPELGDRHPSFLCRFGYAPPPTSRTGRLPWRSRTMPIRQEEVMESGAVV